MNATNVNSKPMRTFQTRELLFRAVAVMLAVFLLTVGASVGTFLAFSFWWSKGIAEASTENARISAENARISAEETKQLAAGLKNSTDEFIVSANERIDAFGIQVPVPPAAPTSDNGSIAANSESAKDAWKAANQAKEDAASAKMSAEMAASEAVKSGDAVRDATKKVEEVLGAAQRIALGSQDVIRNAINFKSHNRSAYVNLIAAVETQRLGMDSEIFGTESKISSNEFDLLKMKLLLRSAQCATDQSIEQLSDLNGCKAIAEKLALESEPNSESRIHAHLILGKAMSRMGESMRSIDVFRNEIAAAKARRDEMHWQVAIAEVTRAILATKNRPDDPVSPSDLLSIRQRLPSSGAHLISINGKETTDDVRKVDMKNLCHILETVHRQIKSKQEPLSAHFSSSLAAASAMVASYTPDTSNRGRYVQYAEDRISEAFERLESVRGVDEKLDFDGTLQDELFLTMRQLLVMKKDTSIPESSPCIDVAISLAIEVQFPEPFPSPRTSAAIEKWFRNFIAFLRTPCKPCNDSQCFTLGIALLNQGRIEDAGVCFGVALQHNSREANYAYGKSITEAVQCGAPIECTPCFRRACDLECNILPSPDQFNHSWSLLRGPLRSLLNSARARCINK